MSTILSDYVEALESSDSNKESEHFQKNPNKSHIRGNA
jgi:hypothetical protein